VSSTIDDVVLTRNFNGLPANYLRPSIVAAGIDADRLDEAIDEERARRRFGGQTPTGARRWVDLLSAGHSVSGVAGVTTVRELIEQTVHEYTEARSHLADVVLSFR
jgi:nitronate monooxygenase